MKTFALISGVLAACAVVLQARESGPLLTALRPSKPVLQLNRLERQKRTLPIVDNVLRGVGETLAGVGYGLFGSRVAPAPVYVPGYVNYVYAGHPNGYYGAGPGYGPGFFGPGPGAPGYGNGFVGYNWNYGLANGQQPMPNNGQYRTGTRYYGPGNGNNGPINGNNQGPDYYPSNHNNHYDKNEGSGCGFTYKSGGRTQC